MDDTDILPDEMLEEVVQARLNTIYNEMAKMRDEWVLHRATKGVETRWRKCQAMYDGLDPESSQTPLEETLQLGPRSRSKPAQQRSRVIINIVAAKVDAAVARMSEILLPVDDRNWGIRPTPDPTMSDDMMSDQPLVNPETGTEATLAEAARAKMAKVRKAAEAMTRKIDDRLTECGYNGELRKAIFDAARIGTGIICGPVPMRQRATVYQQLPGGGYEKVVSEEIVPWTEAKDPWCIYPDPSCGSNHQRGRGVWEKKPATRKELRQLLGVPGYDDKAINQVLREKPKRVRVAEGKLTREDIHEDAYELWLYHGEFEPEQFEVLSSRTGLVDENDEPIAVEKVMLVMVNDRVIGALEPWWDEDLPFDFLAWHEDEDSPFGFGIPDRAESQQRVVNAAWRQVMDNAGNAAGGQIIALKHLIEPANGVWDLEPLKLWKGKDDLDDARKAMHVVELPDRLQNLLTIAQSAMQFAEQESSLPMMMQGDQGGAPDTVGGMTLLMNNATSPLRYRVKRFDDLITRPHIRRYYDWHMSHDPDPGIKGDFEIDARGSTTLIERDIQNQAMLNVAQLGSHPLYGPLLQQKAAAGLRAILKSFKVDPDEFVPTDEELQQQQEQEAQEPPPKDPKVEAAEIQAQLKREEIADRKEDRAVKAALEERAQEQREASLVYNQQREQAEFQIAMTQAQNERDIAFAKLANERNTSVEQLMQDWKIKLLDTDTKRQLFNAEARIAAQKGSGI